MPDGGTEIVTRTVQKQGTVCPQCGEFFEDDTGWHLAFHLFEHAKDNAHYRSTGGCHTCTYCLSYNSCFGGMPSSTYICGHPELQPPEFAHDPFRVGPGRICDYWERRSDA